MVSGTNNQFHHPQGSLMKNIIKRHVVRKVKSKIILGL